MLLLLLLLLLFITIDFSPGGSSPYISIDKTIKNKVYINETIQNTVNTSAHSTKTRTQLSKHTNTLQNTHIHIPTHYKTS